MYEIKQERDFNKINALSPLYNFVVNREYIYCFSWKYNAFFVFNIKTGETEYRETFCEYLPNKAMMFRIALIENKIIAIPYTAEQFIVYDLKTKDAIKIELLMKFRRGWERKFNAYLLYKCKVYFFPGDIDYIYCLDLSNNSLEQLVNVRKALLEKYNYTEDAFFADGGYVKDSKGYLGLLGTNKLIIFNFNGYDLDLISIDEVNDGILSVCGSNNILSILLMNGKVIILDIDTFGKKCIQIRKEDYGETWNTGEERMGIYLDYLYVFPEKIEYSRKINIYNGHIEDVFDEDTMIKLKDSDENIEFRYGYFDNGRLYWYSNVGHIYWYDVINTEEVECICLKYDIDELLQWILSNKQNIYGKIVYEDKFFCNLHFLINVDTEKKNELSNGRGLANSGKLIYKNV
jgi:hypothetical protein